MPEANRDLLVLSKAQELSPDAMKREVAGLHSLLFHTENWQSFCKANEIIDINKHSIIRKPYLIQKIISERKRKPFVFICNKN